MEFPPLKIHQIVIDAISAVNIKEVEFTILLIPISALIVSTIECIKKCKPKTVKNTNE